MVSKCTFVATHFEVETPFYKSNTAGYEVIRATVSVSVNLSKVYFNKCGLMGQ